MDNSKMAEALDAWLADSPDKDILLAVYKDYIAGSSYEENLTAFGKVSYDAPSAINIYADSFKDKDFIAECTERWLGRHIVYLGLLDFYNNWYKRYFRFREYIAICLFVTHY